MISNEKTNNNPTIPNIQTNNISTLRTQFSPLSSTIQTEVQSNTFDISVFKDKDIDIKSWINKMLLPPQSPLSTSEKTSSTSLSNLNNNSESNISSTDIFSANIHENEKSHNDTSLSPYSPITDPEKNLPQQASMLLIKLENSSQQISKSIEKLIGEVVKSIPRVLYDIENIRKDAKVMQDDINNIRQEYRKINNDNAETIQPLFLLNTIRTRMEETKKSLKEAENWSTLSSEMDDIFNAKEYDRAAIRLEEAQNGLTLLQNSADYEERKEILTKYLNRLEAQLSPLLIQAVKNKDLDSMKIYQEIFKKINREKELYSCYFRIIKQEILKFWIGFEIKQNEQQQINIPTTPTSKIQENSTIASQENSSSTVKEETSDSITNDVISNNSTITVVTSNPLGLSFENWVPSFFEEFYSVILKEYTWCHDLFKQPGDIVCNLVNESYKSLKPPFESRLSKLENELNEAFLPSLVRCYQTVEKFSQLVERNILFNKTKNRFLKISSYASSSLGNWGIPLFEPFTGYQQDYAKYELRFLMYQLKKIFNSDTLNNKSPDDLVLFMQNSVDGIFDNLTDVFKRCLALTYGYACPSFVNTINNYLAASLARYSEIVHVIGSRTKIKILNKLKPEQETTTSSTSSLTPKSINHRLPPLVPSSASKLQGNIGNTNSYGSISSSSLSDQNRKKEVNEEAVVDNEEEAEREEELYQKRDRQIWINFQLGFKLLGVCCLFEKEIKQLEQKQLKSFFKLFLSNKEQIESIPSILNTISSNYLISNANSRTDITSESVTTINSSENDHDDTNTADRKDSIPLNTPNKPSNQESFKPNENNNPDESENNNKQSNPVDNTNNNQVDEVYLLNVLYKEHSVGSILSKEIIRTSLLNSYEMKEYAKFIQEKYSFSFTSQPLSTPQSPQSPQSSQQTSSSQPPQQPSSQSPSTTKSNFNILNETKLGMKKLTSECQNYILDAIFVTVEEQLYDLYNPAYWTSGPTKVSPFNFELPQFSLSPLPYVIRIGEHLLSLPQQLELYLNDEALVYSVKTLPYYQPAQLLYRSIFPETKTTPTEQQKKILKENNEKSGETSDTEDEEEASGHIWIISLCNGTMIKYIKGIMSMPKLSEHGAKQLGTDISYLINVLGALEIDILPLLIEMNTLCQMTDQELVQQKQRLDHESQTTTTSTSTTTDTTTTTSPGSEEGHEEDSTTVNENPYTVFLLTPSEKKELLLQWIKLRGL